MRRGDDARPPRGRSAFASRRCARGSTPGLDLPEAAARAAPAALPRDARERARAACCAASRATTQEDEWGFDEEFADLVEPFFDFLYDRWWRVKADGRAERARPRPRAAGRQPRRHPALGRDDDLGRAPARAPAAAPPALPRAQLGLRPALHLDVRSAGSAASSPRPTTRCACSSRTSSWRCSPRGSRAPASPSASATACSASAAAASWRSPCAPARRSCPVAVVGSEEIYPKLGELPSARAADRRALLPAHADVPVARPARRGAAAVEVADRVLRADRDRRLRARRGEPTARWCSSCPSRCARRCSRRSTPTW